MNIFASMKSIKIFLAFLLTTNFSILVSQEFDWAMKMGGTGNDRGLDVFVDNQGFIYTTGYFNGIAEFSSDSTNSLRLTSRGQGDIFVTKQDNEGKTVWARGFGSNETDEGYSITVDLNKNIYVTGYFRGSIDFSTSIHDTFILTSQGSYNIFILKLDSNGNFLFAKQFKALGIGNEIITDSNSNIYISGFFGNSGNFNTSGDTFMLNSKGSSDIFVTKLDSLGNLVWAKSIGTPGNDRGRSIDVDNEGCLYITGFFSGDIDLDPDPDSVYMKYSGGGLDIFVLKLNNDGKFVWGNSLSSGGQDQGVGISVDSKKNVFITGYLNLKYLLVKFDSTGLIEWINKFDPENGWGYDVAIDKFDNVYATGYFGGSTDFDPDSSKSYILNSNGGLDVFVVKYSNDGKFLNSFRMGGGGSEIGHSIFVRNEDDIYVTGHFTSVVDFKPNEDSFSLSSNGGEDIFIWKMRCVPDTTIITITACDSFTWINGTTYFQSDTISTFKLKNSKGCDSVLLLNLTLYMSSTLNVNQTACDSYTWANGVTYYESTDTPTYTTVNSRGCLRTFKLNLMLNHSSNSIDYHEACDSFTWIDGNTYYESDSTSIFKLTNSAGCDSIVKLNLIINKSKYRDDEVFVCDSFTWIDGKKYYDNNDEASMKFSTDKGCDSVVNLKLVVMKSYGIDSVIACNSYTWIDGIEYFSSVDSVKHVITNSFGCDSVISLNLIINQPTFYTDQHVVCDSLIWINGKTYYENNDSALFILTNSNECDSVVKLDLVVNKLDLDVYISNDTIFSNIDYDTVKWVDCNDNFKVIDGEVNYYFVPKANGSFAAILSKNDCTDTSNCVVYFNSNIKYIDYGIKLYPNPVYDRLNISSSEEFTFEVIDVNSTVIKKGRSENKNCVIEGLISGVYFIKIQIGSYTKVAKVVFID